MPNVDLYEHAYQTIYKSVAKSNPYARKSDLRRLAIQNIREGLRLHVALEDIDSRDYYYWPPEKKLNWLEDLNEFTCKTLGEKRYLELRDSREKAW